MAILVRTSGISQMGTLSSDRAAARLSGHQIRRGWGPRTTCPSRAETSSSVPLWSTVPA